MQTKYRGLLDARLVLTYTNDCACMRVMHVGWVGGAKFTAGVVHIISAKSALKYVANS